MAVTPTSPRMTCDRGLLVRQAVSSCPRTARKIRIGKIAKAERRNTICPAGMPSPEDLISVDMVTKTVTDATLSAMPIIGDPDCAAATVGDAVCAAGSGLESGTWSLSCSASHAAGCAERLGRMPVMATGCADDNRLAGHRPIKKKLMDRLRRADTTPRAAALRLSRGARPRFAAAWRASRCGARLWPYPARRQARSSLPGMRRSCPPRPPP